MCARPEETFDVEALMQTFGRMRLDVENCVRELVAFGITKKMTPAGGAAPTLRLRASPKATSIHDLLDEFLERRATVSSEDRSPAVQRFREMIGSDEKMLVIFEWIRTAAKSDIAVLILGPTGSGKELVARMIHELSRRGTHRFQAVNCAALPDTLFESEIFGYEKGAFTGAHDRKPGRLELANNGTLFLDEIGDMSLIAQAKLLRVLEERRFERLGGNTSIEVNFRLISATNRPLDAVRARHAVPRGSLLPRQRLLDPPAVAARARRATSRCSRSGSSARYCAANGLPLDGKSFAKEAADLLMQYHWPGNIRELESTVVARRAVVARPRRSGRPTSSSCTRTKRRPSPRAIACRRSPTPNAPTSRGCSRASTGTRSRRPRVLEISRGTLYRKIVEYGLEEAPPASRNRTSKGGKLA